MRFPIWTREAVAIILIVILVVAILYLTGVLTGPHVFNNCGPATPTHNAC
jgi:hypothetical protein